MKQDHLRHLCSTLDLGAPIGAPTAVPGGFHHRMWRLETERRTYAIKELFANADLSNEATVRHYETAEAIADAFARRGISAAVALKTAGHYLNIVEESGYLVYPWCNAIALDRRQIDERHGLKVARLLARMHGLNINLTATAEKQFDSFPPEKVDDLVQRADACRVSCARALRDHRDSFKELIESHNDAIQSLEQTLLIGHGDLDQKNVLWDDRDDPVIIDWESAGKLNPTYEIVLAALDWSGITSPEFNPELFRKMLVAYREASGTLDAAAVQASFHYIKGEWVIWLLYVVALSLDETDPRQKEIEAKQIDFIFPTIFRVKKLEPDLLALSETGQGTAGTVAKKPRTVPAI